LLSELGYGGSFLPAYDEKIAEKMIVTKRYAKRGF